MPQHFNNQIEELTEEEFIDCIGDTDYIFIMTKDGLLKTVLIPEEMENLELPDNVKKVIQIFDIDDLQPHTLH